MRSVPVLAALALLLAPAALAAQAPARESRSPQRAVVVTPGSEVWGPAPAILPAGAQLAVLEGDPTKAGSYSMRLRMPDGYRIPPHFHPSDEHVTVVSGTFQVGMGDRFDAAALKPLPTGSFAMLSPGMRHFARAKGETVIQLHGVGPWSLSYVNPADALKQEGAHP
ncbi:MAG TPA: cupin domain-containing protein [Gemmatimonadales bacterium]|jgi:quercetin dioxygenase-like cupin family protein|nr:cupin domain-containing protein [Gemmatimonadales bacterium]